MIVLGLDISSATIGWSVLLKNSSGITLVDYGHLKPPSKKKAGDSPTTRINFAYDQMQKLVKKYKPDTVAIEDYAKKFSRGKSSINTILVLAAFNEACGLSCFRATGKEPVRMPVRTLRSLVEKEYKESIKDKDEVMTFCQKIFLNFKTQLNRAGKIKEECYDETDSIIVALGFLLEQEI